LTVNWFKITKLRFKGLSGTLVVRPRTPNMIFKIVVTSTSQRLRDMATYWLKS